MTLSEYQIEKRKQETRYLENRIAIKNFLEQQNWQDVLRYMIENLDSIDDINNSQSIEMFKLVTSLEDALLSYSRIFDNVHN